MKHLKISAILILTTLCFAFSGLQNDQPGKKENKVFYDLYENNNIMAVDSRKLEANNISTWFRTNGNFNREPTTKNSGFEWPRGGNKFARYATGLWMGAIVNGATLVAVAEYDYEYLPGYIDINGIPQGRDNPNYRIYNITLNDTSDYGAWRTIASGQGAYLDNNGNPFRMGAQTMFYSYTDGYPDAHNSMAGSTLPLKAQILQTNWCYINAGTKDIIFSEFKIINRNSSPWTNACISVWTDDDLGEPMDDAIGCDTIRNLGYTYNAEDFDPIYGTAPPAVGTRVLRSPLIFTGNPNDTVKYYNPPGSNNLRVRIGYKYSGLPIFNTYFNGQDPGNYIETYSLLNGLQGDGSTWINPVTGQSTTQTYSGDPVTGSGWVMSDGNDRRFLQSFGPMNINPNDTQSIIIAQVIAKGSSNLNSISQLRALSDLAKMLYDQNFQSVVSVNNNSTIIPGAFSLNQNYPNPFNPVTNLEFGISKLGFVSLKVYDMLGKEVAVLVNENLSPGTYRYSFDASELSSGLYFYTLNVGGFSETKRMMLLK